MVQLMHFFVDLLIGGVFFRFGRDFGTPPAAAFPIGVMPRRLGFDPAHRRGGSKISQAKVRRKVTACHCLSFARLLFAFDRDALHRELHFVPPASSVLVLAKRGPG